jgi:MFS superfamily sulfate permease-like transporter
MGTKIATLLISLVSCIVLYVVKMHINEKYKDKLPAPIPVELIVVVIGTAVSYAGRFNEDYGVKTIGVLPLGFPAPRIPPLNIIGKVFGDALTIAIVSFAM